MEIMFIILGILIGVLVMGSIMLWMFASFFEGIMKSTWR